MTSSHLAPPWCRTRFEISSACAMFVVCVSLHALSGGQEAVAAEPAARARVAPNFPVADPARDLCEGLVKSKSALPMAALNKPGKGQSVTDPRFGTRTVRITDVAEDFKARIAKPMYSTVPAWNADESMMILYVTEPARGHALFDGRTYRFIRFLKITPTDIEHVYWSSTDPDVLFYPLAWEASGISLRRLIKFHVSSGYQEVIHEFPDAGAPGAYRVDFGGDPVYSSWDNDLFGFRRRGRTDTAFTFRLSTAHETQRVTGDAPQIAPSGTKFLLGDYVGDINTLTVIRKRKVKASEHGDMTLLANGQDVWASVQFDGYAGTLVTENLNTGQVKTVIGPSTGYPYPPSGTHISGHAFKAPGWVAVSVTGDPSGKKMLHQEILLANLNNGSVCRVAHHRTAGKDGPNGYWAEPHITISPSGTRMVFASDWSGGSTVDSYVVELPSYRP